MPLKLRGHRGTIKGTLRAHRANSTGTLRGTLMGTFRGTLKGTLKGHFRGHLRGPFRGPYVLVRLRTSLLTRRASTQLYLCTSSVGALEDFTRMRRVSPQRHLNFQFGGGPERLAR